MKLVLDVPGRPMNANDRPNRWQKAAQTKNARSDAAERALEQWGAVGRLGALALPATIHVVDHSRTKRTRDPMNCAPSIKAIVDGLTDYRLWPDDSAKFVRYSGVDSAPCDCAYRRDHLIVTIQFGEPANDKP